MSTYTTGFHDSGAIDILRDDLKDGFFGEAAGVILKLRQPNTGIQTDNMPSRECANLKAVSGFFIEGAVLD
ncbi:unnamed protein product [Clonostachys rhizophaga]|uniref:Uncharacterized protein n=1 Tax=Clonostachys rhizophaga TaxID=160324 RepID=A0A9N9YJR5_9HYPO|nr:unnamed protein product [Clonostachys rhizophaga]